MLALCMSAVERLERIKVYVDFLNNVREDQLVEIFSNEPVLEEEDPIFGDNKQMAEGTLKELGAPKLEDEPLCIVCIVFPTLEKPNSSFLNLLPKFYGHAGEDPLRHFK